MTTFVRTRNTSEGPASRPPPGSTAVSGSRYESWSDRRDEITTNDAPEWQSTRPRSTSKTTASKTTRRFAEESESPQKSRIAFKAPSVVPSDSVSRVKSRPPNGREYEVSTRTEMSTSKRRPRMYSRASSEEGTAWSGSGAPLTENNLERFNEAPRRSLATTVGRSSRRASRQESYAVEDEPQDEARTVTRSTRAARRRSTTIVEEENVTEAPAKSAYRSATTGIRKASNAQSTRSQRARTDAQASYPSASSNTQVVAAGAVGAAATQAAGQTEQRRNAGTTAAEGTKVSARRSSRAGTAPGTEKFTSSKVAERKTTVESQDAPASSSSPSRPSPPSEPRAQTSPTSATSATLATPPGDMEWERRVRIREYVRPSDGRLVRDREICVRKLYPPQVPRVASAVQA